MSIDHDPDLFTDLGEDTQVESDGVVAGVEPAALVEPDDTERGGDDALVAATGDEPDAGLVDGIEEVVDAEPVREVDADEVEWLYPNVYEFVGDYLVVVYARPTRDGATTHKWCSKWWEHPEAVSRLDALWRAFETLRQDPGLGPGTWWRDYADPMMRELFSAEGAFAACGPTLHKPPAPFPAVRPPDWLTHG